MGRRRRRSRRRLRCDGSSTRRRQVPAMVDELPLLACLATRAEGETVITGAGELRVKESDRITAVVANLRAIGADAEELPDGMRIRGSDAPLSRPRRHARRPSAGDGVRHPGRCARQFDRGRRSAIASPCRIPRFWTDLASVHVGMSAPAHRDRDRRTGGVGQVVDRAVGRPAARLSSTSTRARSTERPRRLRLMARRIARGLDRRRRAAARRERVTLGCRGAARSFRCIDGETVGRCSCGAPT